MIRARAHPPSLLSHTGEPRGKPRDSAAGGTQGQRVILPSSILLTSLLPPPLSREDGARAEGATGLRSNGAIRAGGFFVPCVGVCCCIPEPGELVNCSSCKRSPGSGWWLCSKRWRLW